MCAIQPDLKIGTLQGRSFPDRLSRDGRPWVREWISFYQVDIHFIFFRSQGVNQTFNVLNLYSSYDNYDCSELDCDYTNGMEINLLQTTKGNDKKLKAFTSSGLR